MNALSLFTGIMGIDIACEWVGIETIAMCERDEFCQKVIRKKRPHIPLYDDVCTLTKRGLELDGIDCNSIGLIHGGYPCQPFSAVGQRKGEEDDRHLWPEVKRLLEEIRPRWFVGENVAGHISMGLDQVLTDLESIDYTAEPIVIPACAIGTFHRRDRVFILAHANGIMRKAPKIQTSISIKGLPQKPKQWEQFQFINNGNNDYVFRQEDQSLLCRTDDGIPRELDEPRLKAVGNAVNPYQIYPILAAIKQIDDMMKGANP